MICFPLNNMDYEADALGAWFGTRTRGVFSADNHFSVSTNGDMTVTVGGGLAWLLMGDYWGTVVLETDPQTLTIDTADGSLARVDAICLQLDKNANLAKITIKKGAYSPQPAVITAPARDQDYDEVYVASVTVRAGATSILPTDITDLRLDETYCGVMRDGVSGIPTQALQDMWTVWFSAWKTQTDQDFEAWFDTVKGLLGEDEAGALALAIEDVKGMVTNPNLLINGGFDVWQRGAGPFSVGATTTYTADRWAAYAIGGGTATVAKQDAGVLSLTGKYAFLVQAVEPLPSFDRSKPYTFSIDLKRDSGNTGVQMGIALKDTISGDWIYQDQINAMIGINEWNRVSITSSGLEQYTANYLMVYIKVNAPSGGTLYARRAKLEQGSVATPYVPADYATELMRYMRYYWRPETYLYTHFVPADRDQWYLLVGLVFPVRMRVAPTTTIYEPHNIFLNEPDYGGYKFGAEDWGAPDHIWPLGDSDRTNYERLKEWGVKVDGLTELLIEDFGNPDTPPDNDRWAYYFHAEFDAEIY